MSVCSICDCTFDMDAEGGVNGFIGILEVNFCPTCKCGVLDFADQCRPPEQCGKCGAWNDEDDEEKAA